jgi:transcription elongation GreA/GreB family factor
MEPERTPDGRYIIVNGRKWRASDPGLSPERRQSLVDDLMDARRAVKAAKQTGDEDAEREARARVHRAKVDLGERGAPWWEQPRS